MPWLYMPKRKKVVKTGLLDVPKLSAWWFLFLSMVTLYLAREVYIARIALRTQVETVECSLGPN